MSRTRQLAIFACCAMLAAGHVHAGINEWTYVGLAPEYINSIEVDPTNPEIVFVSAYDVYWDSTAEGGLFRTTDHGLTWDTLGFRYSNVHDISIDRQNPQTLWIANDEWGAFQSTDGGDSWENRSDGIYLGGVDNFGVDIIAACPYDSDHLICGTQNWVSEGMLYFSNNAGVIWQQVLEVNYTGKHFLAFDPASPGIVYVTNEHLDFAYISEDTGRSFTHLLPYGNATTFALKTAPHQPGLVWRLTWEFGLQESRDYGLTWTNASHWLGQDTFAWDMDAAWESDTIAFATNYGPFLSLDGGRSARLLAENHPPNSAVDVARIVSREPFEIWARRLWTGIWTYTVADTAGSADDWNNDAEISATTLELFPNPFNSTATLSFTLPRTSRVSLHVFNILGQVVYQQDLGRLEAGVHRQIFDAGPLPSGVYLARVEAGGTSQMRKLIVLK